MLLAEKLKFLIYVKKPIAFVSYGEEIEQLAR